MEKKITICLKTIFYILILLFSLLILIFPIDDTDIWWHLKTGEIILENKALPKYDIFSFTAQNNEWTHHEWLFEIVVYLIFKFSGYNGLIFFKCLILFFSFFFIIKSSILFHKNFTLISILFLIILIFSRDNLILRPHLLTIFFGCLYTYILLDYINNNKKYIYFIPFLQIIWVNSHAGFIISGIIFFVFFLSTSFNYVKRIDNQNKVLILSLVFIFTIIASLLNPIGYKIFIFPFEQILQKSIYMKNISEWYSPFHPYFANTPVRNHYLIWLFFIIFLFVLNFKKLDFLSISYSVFFIILSFTGIRHSVLSYFLTLPFLTKNFNELLSYFYLRFKNEFKDLVLLPLSIIVVGIIFLLFKNIVLSHFGLNGEYQQPQQIVNYILKNNIKGNIFNSFELGGYLLFKLYPKNKVFIDSRANIVYDNEIFREYLSCFESIDSIEKIISKYDISIFILQYPKYIHGKKIKNEMLIHNYLKNSKKWHLVFFDDSALLYLKEKEDFIPFLKEEYKVINPVLQNIANIDNKEELGKSLEEYRKAIINGVNSAIAYTNLGIIFYKLGNFKEAIECFNKLIKMKKNLVVAYSYLAFIYFNNRSYELAISLLEKAISINPYISDLYINIAQIYMHKSEYRKAKYYFKKALRLNPSDPANDQIKTIIKAIEQGKIK